MLTLNTIKAHPGATKKRKRLGRGSGSGHGQTAGKGDKGQLARSGGVSRPGFEGGQMPLYRRIPKRGFKNFARRSNAIMNLVDIELMDNKEFPVINLETLREAGKVKGRHDRLTILANGELTKAFTVKAHRISGAAQEKITKAGGKVELIAVPEGKKRPRARKLAAAAAKAAK